MQQRPTDDIAFTGSHDLIAELTRTPKTFPRSASSVNPDARLPPYIRFQGELPAHQNNEF